MGIFEKKFSTNRTGRESCRVRSAVRVGTICPTVSQNFTFNSISIYFYFYSVFKNKNKVFSLCHGIDKYAYSIKSIRSKT